MFDHLAGAQVILMGGFRLHEQEVSLYIHEQEEMFNCPWIYFN